MLTHTNSAAKHAPSHSVTPCMLANAQNSSAPGLLADMLMGALNMIGFSWAASPASTELEIIAMDWLAKLVGTWCRDV
eukprot:301291-Chlamydomonas_euryale.AAC.2